MLRNPNVAARIVASGVVASLLLGGSESLQRQVHGQARIGSGRLVPFVVGWIPVVGNGVVGGVSIDSDGVVARATTDDEGKLRKAWEAAMRELPADVARSSKLRKVSLRRLEETLAAHLEKKVPFTDEMQYLAGLQRIEYVFVYPDSNDIVLAGPAEGWRVDKHGNIVGLETGRPVIQLADLIVAVRAAESAARGDISCSIDPTEEGLVRLQRMLAGRISPTTAAVTRMEQTLGPQQITVSGVDPHSHFARVLVGADVIMKRLAMNFERSPVRGMPSYLELLKSGDGPPPRNLMPRWWLAANYDALLKDEDGLAWQLRGPGVKVLTEDEYLSRDGVAVASDKSHREAQQWADTMTDKYAELAREIPVFHQLRNCMDLAIVAALSIKENLIGKADNELPLLSDPKALELAKFPVPRTVPSQASLSRKGRDVVVSISGGVEINTWSILENTAIDARLAKLRANSTPPGKANWWWD